MTKKMKMNTIEFDVLLKAVKEAKVAMKRNNGKSFEIGVQNDNIFKDVMKKHGITLFDDECITSSSKIEVTSNFIRVNKGTPIRREDVDAFGITPFAFAQKLWKQFSADPTGVKKSDFMEYAMNAYAMETGLTFTKTDLVKEISQKGKYVFDKVMKKAFGQKHEEEKVESLSSRDMYLLLNGGHVKGAKVPKDISTDYAYMGSQAEMLKDVKSICNANKVDYDASNFDIEHVKNIGDIEYLKGHKFNTKLNEIMECQLSIDTYKEMIELLVQSGDYDKVFDKEQELAVLEKRLKVLILNARGTNDKSTQVVLDNISFKKERLHVTRERLLSSYGRFSSKTPLEIVEASEHHFRNDFLLEVIGRGSGTRRVRYSVERVDISRLFGTDYQANLLAKEAINLAKGIQTIYILSGKLPKGKSVDFLKENGAIIQYQERNTFFYATKAMIKAVKFIARKHGLDIKKIEKKLFESEVTTIRRNCKA